MNGELEQMDDNIINESIMDYGIIAKRYLREGTLKERLIKYLNKNILNTLYSCDRIPQLIEEFKLVVGLEINKITFSGLQTYGYLIEVEGPFENFSIIFDLKI